VGCEGKGRTADACGILNTQLQLEHDQQCHKLPLTNHIAGNDVDILPARRFCCAARLCIADDADDY
jgi:hypothetical protein